jgi:hypothetical protein
MRTVLTRLVVLTLALATALPAQTRGAPGTTRTPSREAPATTPAPAQGTVRTPAPGTERAPAAGTPRTAAPGAVRTAPSVRRNPSAPVGTFMATRIDRDTLPLQDRVVDEDGTLYLIEFDRLVIALNDDLSFRASVRYRRTLFSAAPRGRGRTTPLQSMTVTGTYEVNGAGEIRFTPDESNETKGLRMMAGMVRSARELSIPFHYRNGTQERDRTLTLTRRDNIL